MRGEIVGHQHGQEVGRHDAQDERRGDIGKQQPGHNAPPDRPRAGGRQTRGRRADSGQASATTPANSRDDPRAAPVDRGAPRPGVPNSGQARRALPQARTAEQHARVLDMRAERGAARGAVGEVAVGDAGLGLLRCGGEAHRAQRLALEHAFPVARRSPAGCAA